MSLGSLVERVVSEHQTAVSAMGVALDVRIDEGLPEMNLDDGLMEQVADGS